MFPPLQRLLQTPFQELHVNDCGDSFIYPKSNILPVKARELDGGINNLEAIWDWLIHKLVCGAYELDEFGRPCSLGIDCHAVK